jgi:hypothetical protein
VFNGSLLFIVSIATCTTLLSSAMSYNAKKPYAFLLGQSKNEFELVQVFLETAQLLVVPSHKGYIQEYEKQCADLLREMEEKIALHSSEQLERDIRDEWSALLERVDNALNAFKSVSKRIHANALESQSTHVNAGFSDSTVRFHTGA